MVSSDASSLAVASATSATARSKAAAFTCDGFVVPETFRTYCSAAASISADVAGGAKLWSGRMFRHMGSTLGSDP